MGWIVNLLTGGLASIFGVAGRAVKWLIANPAVLLLAAFVAVFAFTVITKDNDIAALQRAVAARDQHNAVLTVSLTTQVANVHTLTNALQQQNTSMIALRDQGVAASARFDKITSLMTTANVASINRVAALDRAVSGGDKCASALALIRSNVQ